MDEKSVEIRCPKCGTAGTVTDEFIDKKLKCKRCGISFKVRAVVQYEVVREEPTLRVVPEVEPAPREGMIVDAVGRQTSEAGASSAVPEKELAEVPRQDAAEIGASSATPPESQETPEVAWTFTSVWKAECSRPGCGQTYTTENYPCPVCGGQVVVEARPQGTGLFGYIVHHPPYRMYLRCLRECPFKDMELIPCENCGADIIHRDIKARVPVYKGYISWPITILYLLSIPTFFVSWIVAVVTMLIIESPPVDKREHQFDLTWFTFYEANKHKFDS